MAKHVALTAAISGSAALLFGTAAGLTAGLGCLAYDVYASGIWRRWL